MNVETIDIVGESFPSLAQMAKAIVSDTGVGSYVMPGKVLGREVHSGQVVGSGMLKGPGNSLWTDKVERNKVRVHRANGGLRPINEVLDSVAMGIGALSMQAHTSNGGVHPALARSNLDEVIAPYSVALSVAAWAIAAAKNGIAQIDGNSIKVERLWDQGKTHVPPQLLRVRAMQDALRQITTASNAQYETWQKDQERMVSDLGNRLREADSSAHSMSTMNRRLVSAYRTLETAVGNQGVAWLVPVFGALDMRRAGRTGSQSVLTAIEQLERSARSAATHAITTREGVEGILTREEGLQQSGRYVLTSSDIRMLQSDVRGLAQVGVVTSSTDTLFSGGVTTKDERLSALVDVLRLDVTLAPLIGSIESYSRGLQQVADALRRGNHEFGQGNDFDRTTLNSASELITDLPDVASGLSRRYNGAITTARDLESSVQERYASAVSVLQGRVETFLNPELKISDRRELREQKEKLNRHLQRITSAREFTYGGVTPQDVVTDDQLGYLTEFKAVLDEVYSKVQAFESRARGNPVDQFNDAMSTVARERNYGPSDRYFMDAVADAVNALYVAEQVPDANDIQVSGGEADPRVAGVVDSLGPVNNGGTLDESLVRQLGQDRAKIDDTNLYELKGPDGDKVWKNTRGW
jgi:hypothetical protein